MNKRLIIIISIGLVLLLAALGLLFWAVGKNKQQSQQTASSQSSGQLKKILDDQIISPINSLDNNSIWYFTSEGRLFRVNIDGSGLSEFPLPVLGSGKLSRALWPKDGSDFIAISNDSTQTKSFYDSTLKTYMNLPLQIQYIDWMPDSKRVVYIWQSADKKKQQLVLSNADGTGFVSISDVFWPDLAVKAGPDGKTVLMYRTNIQGDTNKVYAADLATGNITALINSGKNTEAKWVSASRFMFSQSGITQYPKVFLYDFTNQQSVDLGINTTLDKIVLDPAGQSLYAAVPKKDNSGDSFVKIDLTTFKQDTFYEPDQPVRGKNLMLLGQSLFFTNTLDGKLYEILK